MRSRARVSAGDSSSSSRRSLAKCSATAASIRDALRCERDDAAAAVRRRRPAGDEPGLLQSVDALAHPCWAFNAGGFFVLVYAVARLLPSGIASTVMATSPLALVGFGWMLLGQRPHALSLVGALAGVAVTGVALGALVAGEALTSRQFLGLAIVLVGIGVGQAGRGGRLTGVVQSARPSRKPRVGTKSVVPVTAVEKSRMRS